MIYAFCIKLTTPCECAASMPISVEKLNCLFFSKNSSLFVRSHTIFMCSFWFLDVVESLYSFFKSHSLKIFNISELRGFWKLHLVQKSTWAASQVSGSSGVISFLCKLTLLWIMLVNIGKWQTRRKNSFLCLTLKSSHPIDKTYLPQHLFVSAKISFE